LKKPQDAVFLRCDEKVPFGVFASVIDALRQAGINNISIVTQAADGAEPRVIRIMNGVIANTEEVRFTPYITASGILHGGLIVLIAVSAYFHWDGNRWAGPGGGSENVTNVKLVGNSGMPLPTPPSLNESNVVDPSKSLWKNDIKPEAAATEKRRDRSARFEERAGIQDAGKEQQEAPSSEKGK
jgi:hypothetical protein